MTQRRSDKRRLRKALDLLDVSSDAIERWRKDCPNGLPADLIMIFRFELERAGFEIRRKGGAR